MRLIFGALFCVGIVVSAWASDFATLGPSDETILVGDTESRCEGTAFSNHDNSFEAAFGWQYGGVAPPYYGAFGEGCALGAVTIECLTIWLTRIATEDPTVGLDAYIWEGGVTSEPQNVIYVLPGVDPGIPGAWPVVTELDVPVGFVVEGDITVGYWADFSGTLCEYYLAADTNGPEGHPWTCVAPGSGFPSGWQHPDYVLGSVQSWALGGYYTEGGAPASSLTWGAIKGLFE